MTAGPGARLDAENDNLQAYCNNLEAEIGTLRERIRAQLEVISALKEHRAEDAQRIVALEQRLRTASNRVMKDQFDALEQRLREALKLLRDGDDNFTMDHHPGCNDHPCNCGLGKHLVAVRRLVDTFDNAALLAKQHDASNSDALITFNELKQENTDLRRQLEEARLTELQRCTTILRQNAERQNDPKWSAMATILELSSPEWQGKHRCTCGDDFVAVTGAHDTRCPLAKQP